LLYQRYRRRTAGSPDGPFCPQGTKLIASASAAKIAVEEFEHCLFLRDRLIAATTVATIIAMVVQQNSRNCLVAAP
jgi:Holliday junction resolvasome RuvABC ATP-dependent DNA helicase subunit